MFSGVNKVEEINFTCQVLDKMGSILSKADRIETVIDRSNKSVPFNMNEIVKTICVCIFRDQKLDLLVDDVVSLIQSVFDGMVDKMSTYAIVELCASTAISKSIIHPDFEVLAVRLSVWNMHTDTEGFKSMKSYLNALYFNDLPKEKLPFRMRSIPSLFILGSGSRLATSSYVFAMKWHTLLDKIICFERDYDYNWFGFQTMIEQYTLKIPFRTTEKIKKDEQDNLSTIKYGKIERPQHSYLRFALEALVPDPERYFHHIAHLNGKPAHIWNDNYDDLNTVAWDSGSKIDKKKQEYLNQMLNSSGITDDSHKEVMETSETFFKQQKQKPEKKICYEDIQPSPMISNLLNPFNLPAEDLSKIYQNLSKQGWSDSKIFDFFMTKCLTPRSPKDDLNILMNVVYLYHLLSLKIFSPPTTIFQPGKKFISCFLVGKPGDSIPLIFAAPAEGAKLGKEGGGYSTRITDVRATQSYINGSNSISAGILPVMGIMDLTCRYVRQKGNHGRSGPNTTYIEPYHMEFIEFLNTLRTESGDHFRLTELNGAVFMNELLIKRSINQQQWTFFCPADVPDLATTFGSDFEKAYIKYEQDPSISKKTFKAEEIVLLIAETLHDVGKGTCNLLHCDNFNRFSMYKCPEIGTKIRSSNICLEIANLSTKYETSTCNIGSATACSFYLSLERALQIERLFDEFNWLNSTSAIHFNASIIDPEIPKRALQYFGAEIATCNVEDFVLDTHKRWLHFEELGKIENDIKNATHAPKKIIAWKFMQQLAGFGNYLLSCIINQTSYPSFESLIGGMHQRSVGFGCQGFHDLLVKLKLPYDSPMAANLLFKIKENLLYGAYSNSIDMAKIFGITPYWETVNKAVGKNCSLDARGVLPFDLYYEFNPNLKKRMRVEEVSSKSVKDLLNEDPNFFYHERLFNSETTWKAPDLNWELHRNRLKKVGGKYNMNLQTAMPNATSSIVTRNNPSHEPPMNLFGKQKTVTGEYRIIPRDLVLELIKMGKWDSETRLKIENNEFQSLDLPKEFKELFRTAWEIDPKSIILMYFHGQVVTDHSQSMNMWQVLEKIDESKEYDSNIWTAEMKATLRRLQIKKILDIIIYGSTVCQVGLKTLSYYLHKDFIAPSNLTEIIKLTEEYTLNEEAKKKIGLAKSDNLVTRFNLENTSELPKTQTREAELCISCTGD